MLFFDDKLLLKYSGVTGSRLAIDRADIARAAARAARDNYGAPAACDAYHNAYHAAYHAAYTAACDAYDAAQEHARPLKPFKSSSDIFLSALSIISAPILLTLLALDEMFSFIISSIKSIVDLCTSGTDEAKKSGAKAVGHLLNAFKSLLAAAVSPVVNAVDFVGSCVTTLKATNMSGEGQHTTVPEEDDDDDAEDCGFRIV